MIRLPVFRALLLGVLGRGAKHLHQWTTIIRAIFGALPDGLPQEEIELGGKMIHVPEHTRVRVVAHGDRRISHEAILAR